MSESNESVRYLMARAMMHVLVWLRLRYTVPYNARKMKSFCAAGKK